MTLANKYRPAVFDDVIGQDVCTTILKKQIKDKTYSHAILFAGNAGCGKTTCARIFAKSINAEKLEIDCASHNGVADVKEIIEFARKKPLLHNYKVIILDECHTLSSQAWSSMLVTLEENLPYAIFVFCTTDTKKIPSTIMSRVQRFNYLPITDNDIMKRLSEIRSLENIQITDEALSFIVSSAKGNLRQALTNFDKCLMYNDLTVKGVCKALNIVSKNVHEDLYRAFNDNNREMIIKIVSAIYRNGYELHQFVEQFLDFCIYKDNLELVDRLLTIIQDIRYDDTPKNIIIARLII